VHRVGTGEAGGGVVPVCVLPGTRRRVCQTGHVAAGRWRATRPDANGHAGFRLNALVSLLANASLNTPQVNPPPNQPQLETPLGRPLGTNFGDRLAVGMFLGRD